MTSSLAQLTPPWQKMIRPFHRRSQCLFDLPNS